MRTRVSSEATTSERRDDRARERMNMVETSSIWEKMRVAVQVSAKKVGAAEIRTTTLQRPREYQRRTGRGNNFGSV